MNRKTRDVIETVFGVKREDYDHDFRDALTLGQVIDILKMVSPDKRIRKGFAAPHSYRGYYDCLAFQEVGNTTVKDMLVLAERCVDYTFTGWKGGNFSMDEGTKVFLASMGCTGKPLTERKLLSMLGVTKKGLMSQKKSESTAKKASKPKKGQCDHIDREPLPLPARFGTQRGGIAVGRCQNKCYPGLTVCYEHADKATLDALCGSLRNEITALKKELADAKRKKH